MNDTFVTFRGWVGGEIRHRVARDVHVATFRVGRREGWFATPAFFDALKIDRTNGQAVVTSEYIKTNWDMIFERLSGNMVVLERFVRMCLQKYASYEVDKDIEKFFADKDNTGYDRGLAVVSDTIKGNARYRESDAEIIREWLSAHDYLK